jgi:hypothetical protein
MILSPQAINMIESGSIGLTMTIVSKTPKKMSNTHHMEIMASQREVDRIIQIMVDGNICYFVDVFVSDTICVC